MREAYQREISRNPLLAKQELEEIDYILSNGSSKKQKQEARQKLILSCIRVPLIFAGYFCRKYELDDHEYDEVLQMCNLVLVKASQKYTPGKGAGFHTYAHRSIRKTVDRMLRSIKKFNSKYLAILDVEYEEGGITFGQTIENPKTEQPQEAALKSELEARVYESIQGFDEKKRTILLMRVQGYSQVEIGEFLGVTHQRVSMIEKLVSTGFRRQYRSA